MPGRTMVQSRTAARPAAAAVHAGGDAVDDNFTWSSSSKHTSVSQRRLSRSIQTASGGVDHDLGEGFVVEQVPERPEIVQVVTTARSTSW